MLEKGVIVLDITIDKLKEAMKEKEWREAAEKAYAHASEKVFTEEEKDAIRKEYLKALSDYATFSNGSNSLPDDQHT